jgi:hypothetical protein
VPFTYTARVVKETVVQPVFRQGLARNGDHGWMFSIEGGLFLTDDAYRITRAARAAIPADWQKRGFNHIGDIDVVGDVIYAPLEQPNYKLGRQAVLLYDARTLAFTGAVEIAQNENSFITVDPASGIAYSMMNFGGNALTRYDTRRGWKALPPLRMSTFVDRVQGGDVYNGAVWLSTDDATNGVYRVDLATGEVTKLGSTGRVDGEGEGIDATPTPTGDLHVLNIDAKLAPVRLVDFKVTATPKG